MEKIGKRFLARATTEVQVPKMVELDVYIYSIGTSRPMQAVLDLLKDRGFTPAARPWDFQPRVVDVSGKVSKALDMFAGLSKPDLVSEARILVSECAEAEVSATRSVAYASKITTETDPNGSKRVREEKSEMKFGIFLYLTPVITRQGVLDLTCHRSVSKPTDAAEVGIGKGLLRLKHTSASAKGRLGPADAFVHAEFVHSDNPTPRFSGEVIVTVICARDAGQPSRL